MVIVVHGGAGEIDKIKLRQKVVIKACELGYKVLAGGGSALDAVVRAVVKLEDSPLFNAGTGASPSIEGEVELDAAVMTDELMAGAVACIKDVKNPILVARKVMEETDHVMLSGEGAVRFARLMGFRPYNPLTTKKKRMLESRLKRGEFPKYFPRLKSLAGRFVGAEMLKQACPEDTFRVQDDSVDKYGTVGACALDKYGRMASATSTGGIFMHLPGRIGDTPMIGAGTYACKYGAVSATGHGEWIIKLCLAKLACDAMKTRTAQRAIDLALKVADKHSASCGLIGVDRKGNVGASFNTEQMIWASIKNSKLKVQNE